MNHPGTDAEGAGRWIASCSATLGRVPRVFLFGLSMDYHVFILSRIRELRTRGKPHREAVIGGIASCSGVVTSAAVIMVAVFSIFATLSIIDLKMIGVGLASAVLIDATVVRGVLVPAALALLGERSWYLPRWWPRLLGGRAGAAASWDAAALDGGPGPGPGATPGSAPERGQLAAGRAQDLDVRLISEPTGSRPGAG